MPYKRGIWDRLKRASRYYYLKVMRTKATSHAVAMGIACGAFGSCFPALPPIPLQTCIALGLALMLRAAKVPAVLATWLSNPFNWVFFYIAEYKIGSFFIPLDKPFTPHNWTLADYLEFGWQGLAVMLLGSLVLAVPFSAIAYFVTLPLIRGYRRRRALRILKRRGYP
ncbi:DUF2062 domain-containing protein [Desulfohalovibrio reitneri]|uniref:DUF2062 domain-containing protein n=1 Tax=Desulfohalovibrio reitneri TaxID=1307759 RepID=UPI0004A6EF97|nr:DUF2062 domain-containing protein [Desulfohalovibrio reitneri]